LSSALPEDAQIAARANLEEIEEAYSKARDDYATLFQRHPDNYSYAHNLWRLQMSTRPLDAARATVAAARKLPGGDNAEADLGETMLDAMAGTAGSLPERLQRLDKVRARADAEGSRLVVGSILLAKAEIQTALGQLDAARALAAEAKAIF